MIQIMVLIICDYDDYDGATVDDDDDHDDDDGDDDDHHPWSWL